MTVNMKRIAAILVLCLGLSGSSCLFTNALGVPPKDGILGRDFLIDLSVAETWMYLSGIELVREDLNRRYGKSFVDTFFADYDRSEIVFVVQLERLSNELLDDTETIDFGVSAEPDVYYTRASADACTAVYREQGPYIFKELFVAEVIRAVDNAIASSTTTDYNDVDALLLDLTLTLLLAGQCDLRRTGSLIHVSNGIRF